MCDVADEPPTLESARRLLLESTAQAASESYPALGLGLDVRMRERREEQLMGAGGLDLTD